MNARCPHCGGAINPAALLAQMGKGGRKNFSAAERKRRAKRLAEARSKRWLPVNARFKISVMNNKKIASEWIRTDINAVIADIKRLGLDDAVEYQMDLIADRKAAGDDRWDSVTSDDMRAAMEEIAE